MKGSFTGAYRDKRGRLEAAHKGTIFMDEIGEMSLRMQAMLLRFLETGEIQRVGADRSLPPLDVRHRGDSSRPRGPGDRSSFREDLFYRLNVIHIEVPPLRERRDDIPCLLRYFLEAFSNLHHLPVPEVAPVALQRLLAGLAEMSESSRTWLNGSSFTGVMTASSMSVAADGNRAGATIDRDGVFRSTSG